MPNRAQSWDVLLLSLRWSFSHINLFCLNCFLRQRRGDCLSKFPKFIKIVKIRLQSKNPHLLKLQSISPWNFRVGMGCFVLCFFSTWGIGYWAVVVEAGEIGLHSFSRAKICWKNEKILYNIYICTIYIYMHYYALFKTDWNDIYYVTILCIFIYKIYMDNIHIYIYIYRIVSNILAFHPLWTFRLQIICIHNHYVP